MNAVVVSEKLLLSQAGVCSTHRSLARLSLLEDHHLPLLSLLQAAESSLLMEIPICPAGTQVIPPLPPKHLAKMVTILASVTQEAMVVQPTQTHLSAEFLTLLILLPVLCAVIAEVEAE